MLPHFALLQLVAALIAVEANDARCPSVAQVKAALMARLPGVLAEPRRGGQRGVMRLRLTDMQGLPVVQLFDDDNQLALKRVLGPTGDDSHCGALAETVSIIIERYLVELDVGLVAPPPAGSAPALPQPPPERGGGSAAGRDSPLPRWNVVMQGRWKSGRASPAAAWGAEVAAGRNINRSGTWNAEVALGGALPASMNWGGSDDSQGAGRGGRLNVWALTAIGRRWQVGSDHHLLLRGSGGIGLLRASQSQPPPASSRWGAEPWLGVEGAYRWMLGMLGPKGGAAKSSGLFAQLTLAARVALVRHQVVVLADDEPGVRVIEQTPRIFADVGMGAGVTF